MPRCFMQCDDTIICCALHEMRHELVGWLVIGMRL